MLEEFGLCESLSDLRLYPTAVRGSPWLVLPGFSCGSVNGAGTCGGRRTRLTNGVGSGAVHFVDCFGARAGTRPWIPSMICFPLGGESWAMSIIVPAGCRRREQGEAAQHIPRLRQSLLSRGHN